MIFGFEGRDLVGQRGGVEICWQLVQLFTRCHWDILAPAAAVSDETDRVFRSFKNAQLICLTELILALAFRLGSSAMLTSELQLLNPRGWG